MDQCVIAFVVLKVGSSCDNFPRRKEDVEPPLLGWRLIVGEVVGANLFRIWRPSHLLPDRPLGSRLPQRDPRRGGCWENEVQLRTV